MDQLHTLGKPYDNDMAVNLINRSLNKHFGDFVRNFNMHCVGKTVTELHALLIDFEKGLKDNAPTPQVFTIQKGRDNKQKLQANKKVKGKERKILIRIKLVTTATLLGIGRGTALFISKSCVQIRRSLSPVLQFQGFKEERKLSYGVQYLQVGNGTQAAVEAIGMFDLVLPSGLVLKLNNCYYAPSIVRGVVSLSCLLDLGFHHTIASNGISVSLNGIFYFSAISVNGVFEIDMNNNVSKNNNNSIFSINKKRKLDLNSSYLWHCRLAHIGKTRMQKLHSEGLLENIDEESSDKCESCISGKMTKKPFNKNIERATDLLVVMDMFFLLKHKHEVFETFKVFKAEVELQLGKKIKALRSDRGGEYLSQEFKDYLRYPKETMGYYFYFPPENKVIVARYGDFLERDLISQKFSGRDYDLEDDHMDTLPSENTSEIPVEPESLGPSSELIPVRRSERTARAPNRLCLNMKVEDDGVGDLGEPADYKIVMLDPDKVKWQGAMDEEMKSMNVNKVWIVVDRPPNAKVVRNKWLYKKKTDMDGKVHTYKVRLVGKGCTQTIGIGYQKTFSPVADIRAIRILTAIAAYYDYEIWQMDVKTAFLNGSLDEDIYMEQHEGYVDQKYPNDEEKTYMKKVPYASAVGSIMYAVRCTRPDVAFAQNLKLQWKPFGLGSLLEILE
nr:retrotransposon protein, putative, Ty1-copia subclass [Tanacetum cinerariifolium]